MGYTGYVELSEARRIVARAIEAGLRYRLVNVGNGIAFVSVFTRSEEREEHEQSREEAQRYYGGEDGGPGL